MNDLSLCDSRAAVKLPDRVTPDPAAVLSSAWYAKMTDLEGELRRRGVIMAHKVVAACYGTEPAVVLAALEANRARFSLETTVKRLYHGILNPDVHWTPRPEV